MRRRATEINSSRIRINPKEGPTDSGLLKYGLQKIRYNNRRGRIKTNSI